MTCDKVKRKEPKVYSCLTLFQIWFEDCILYGFLFTRNLRHVGPYQRRLIGDYKPTARRVPYQGDS